MATNSTNINKTKNHLSPLTEHKKDDNVWRWKVMYIYNACGYLEIPILFSMSWIICQ